jgi:hypothetical protein
MSTIVADTDASVRSEASTVVKAKLDPMWAIVALTLGLLSSLAWSGFLVWAIGRMVGIW